MRSKNKVYLTLVAMVTNVSPFNEVTGYIKFILKYN